MTTPATVLLMDDLRAMAQAMRVLGHTESAPRLLERAAAVLLEQATEIDRIKATTAYEAGRAAGNKEAFATGLPGHGEPTNPTR